MKLVSLVYDHMPAVLFLTEADVPMQGYVLVEGEWTTIDDAELYHDGVDVSSEHPDTRFKELGIPKFDKTV